MRLTLFWGGIFMLMVLVPQAAWAADEWTHPTGDIKNPFGGGKGTKDDPYIISTAQHLANLSHMVNYKDKDYSGEYFLMTRDIVLNDNVLSGDFVYSDNGVIRYEDNKEHFDKLKEWESIGSFGTIWDSYFGGNFDGGGHTISGLYINRSIYNGKVTDAGDINTAHGLFGLCRLGNISNLTIKDSYMTPHYTGDEYPRHYGMLVGKTTDNNITNCHIENCMIAGDPEHPSGTMFTGGLVGYSQKASISNCSCNATVEVYQKQYLKTFDDTEFSNPHVFAGGLVGFLFKKYEPDFIHVTDCHTSGKLILNGKEVSTGFLGKSEYAYAGGLIGQIYIEGSHHDLIVSNCTNGMDIFAFSRDKTDTGMYARISGIANSNNFVANSVIEGEINSGVIEDCANYGNIYYGKVDSQDPIESTTDDHYIAGLGYWLSFKNCANYGDIHVARFTNGKDTYIAGLVSGASNDKDDPYEKLINCLSCGRIYNGFESTAQQPNIDPVICTNIGNGTGTVKGCYYNVTVNDESIESSITDGVTKLDSPDMFKSIDLARQLNQSVGSVHFGTMQDKSSKAYGYVLPIVLGASINDMSGEGTADKPYLVYNANDLRCISDMCLSKQDMSGKVFKLAANIDLTYSDALPQIGSEDYPFTGIFDGDGHYIRGMKGYQGAMFDYLGEDAEIKNLALLDAQPTDGEFYGIARFVGDYNNTGASIHDCYVTADIERTATENSGMIMGGICGRVYSGSKVENCYFSGSLKMISNISGKRASVGGIAYNNYGTVSNCHAALSYQDAGTQDTKEYIGAFDNANGTQTNCYMALMLPESKWGVYQKNTADGVTMYDNEESIDWKKLGSSDTWMLGRYHPVLRKTYHYTGMFNATTTGLDPVERLPQNNAIMLIDPTDEQKSDTKLWQMKNVAVKSDTDHAYILSNFTLYPDAGINLSSTVYGWPLVGSASYKVSAQQGDNWFSQCLPGAVKLNSLPDDSKLYVGGTLSNNHMNIVEVDSVPAGVPFLMYCKADNATDFYITTVPMGELKTEPVKAADNSSLQGTFIGNNTLIAKNYCSRVVAGTDGKLYLTHEADGYVSGYTGYVDNSDNNGADVELTQYLLLDESDNLAAKAVADNAGRDLGIKLMRSIKDGGWNTLCLPFDITVDELKERLGDKTNIEILSDVTSDAEASVTLRFDAPADNTIKAGTPILVAPEKWGTLFDFDARTITNEVKPIEFDNVSIGGDTYANITMTGSFGKQLLASTSQANIYFIQGNLLYQAGSRNSVSMLGFRCWLSVTSADGTKAQALGAARVIHADGTTTDIRLVDMGSTDDGSRIYDLQGIEQDAMQRGLNITRGKKVMKR